MDIITLELTKKLPFLLRHRKFKTVSSDIYIFELEVNKSICMHASKLNIYVMKQVKVTVNGIL